MKMKKAMGIFLVPMFLFGCGGSDDRTITGAFGINLGEKFDQSNFESVSSDGKGSFSDQVVDVWDVSPPDPNPQFNHYSIMVDSNRDIVRIFAKTDRMSDCRSTAMKLWPDLKAKYGKGDEKGGKIEQETAALELDCSFPSPYKSGNYLKISYEVRAARTIGKKGL